MILRRCSASTTNYQEIVPWNEQCACKGYHTDVFKRHIAYPALGLLTITIANVILNICMTHLLQHLSCFCLYNKQMVHVNNLTFQFVMVSFMKLWHISDCNNRNIDISMTIHVKQSPGERYKYLLESPVFVNTDEWIFLFCDCHITYAWP